MEKIPIELCRHRGIYRIRCRNLGLGVYDSDRRGFIGIRSKFGYQFLDCEYHRDADPVHGTVSAQEDTGADLPEHIDLVDLTDNSDLFSFLLTWRDDQRG